MEKLVVIEEHPDYETASFRAKKLAGKLSICTGVGRSSTGWTVLAPPTLLPAKPLIPEFDEGYEHIEYLSDYEIHGGLPLCPYCGRTTHGLGQVCVECIIDDKGDPAGRWLGNADDDVDDY